MRDSGINNKPPQPTDLYKMRIGFLTGKESGPFIPPPVVPVLHSSNPENVARNRNVNNAHNISTTVSTEPNNQWDMKTNNAIVSDEKQPKSLIFHESDFSRGEYRRQVRNETKQLIKDSTKGFGQFKIENCKDPKTVNNNNNYSQWFI